MQCSAKTKSGKRCKNKAQAGSEFCGVHAKLAGKVQTAFDYDVFLSYSSKDKETVHALAERLRGDGVRVWLDVWEIEPSAGSLSRGERARVRAEAIQHGVEKSRTMVMCMSPDYFESEWGRLEHHSMLFRDPTNALRRFLTLGSEKPLPLVAGICAREQHFDCLQCIVHNVSPFSPLPPVQRCAHWYPSGTDA